MTLNNQKLAIPARNLREILDPLPHTRVPGAGPVAPWVLNVRGSVMPLADLRIPLGISDSAVDDATCESRRFMVLEVEIAGEMAPVAVIADSVHEVTTIAANRIERLPASSQFPAEFLTGLYRDDDGFVLLPDLTAIFTTIAQRTVAA